MIARRLVAAVAMVLAALVTLPTAAFAAPVQATTTTPETPPAAPAILDLVGCIQGSEHLTVEMLIDESASLKVTDPENRRVDAAIAALDGLLALTSGKGAGQPEVDVALSAFSNTYRSVRPWTAVTPANAASLRTSLDAFRKRNRGTDTDFINALNGARTSLADRSAEVTAEGDSAPCKAVLLFTDGQYDLAVRTTKAQLERFGATKPYAPGIVLDDEKAVRNVEAAGRAELCREDGLADGLRSDDISLLTVALSGTVPRTEQRLLASASAGSADGVTCGKPTEIPPGAYLPAGQVDLLIDRFDEIAARLAGGTLLPPQPVTLCDDEACPEGTRTVQVDPSVRRVHLLALAPKPGMVVQVTGPEGTATVDSAGPTKIGPVSATVRAIGKRGWSIDIDRPAGDAGWSGGWSFAVIDTTGTQVGRPATLQVYVFSDIGVVVDSFGQAERGKPAKVSARLEVPEGVEVAKLLRSAKASLRLDDPVKGTSQTIPLAGPVTGPFTGTFTPPEDYRSSSYDALIELRAVTNDGAEIVARSAPQSILVRRPGGSVQIAPAELEMPSLTGEGSTSADLILLGGAKRGCVWFAGADVTGPDDAGDFEITYGGEAAATKATCVELGGGQNETVDVAVTPSGRATGSVRGVIEVHEQVDGGTETVTLVPFGFDMARGVDEAQRLILAVVLLVGGLLLPLVLLMVINALTARFQSLDAVQGAVIPVMVSGKRIYRGDPDSGSRPFRINASDFTSLAGRGGPRRFAFGGVVFTAKASANPFGPTYALAAPEGGAEKLKGNAGSKVELDPHLAGSWVFLLDPDRTRDLEGDLAAGDLILFLAEGETRAQIDKVVPDIIDRLPSTAARLAGLLRARPVKPLRGRKARAAVAAEAEAAAAARAEAGEDDDDRDDDGEAIEAPEVIEPAEPAGPAPLGFGGVPIAPDAPVLPAAPGGDADDAPSAAPLGFGGVPRPVEDPDPDPDPGEPGA